MHFFIFSLIGVMTGLLMALFGIGGGAFIVPALDTAFLAVPNSAHPPFQLIVIGSLCTIVIGSLPRAIKDFLEPLLQLDYGHFSVKIHLANLLLPPTNPVLINSLR